MGRAEPAGIGHNDSAELVHEFAPTEKADIASASHPVAAFWLTALFGQAALGADGPASAILNRHCLACHSGAEALIETSGHQMGVSLPTEPLSVEANPVRLSQVVANLLNNAAKCTEPGGEIWLAAVRENGHVSISVRDTGVGISAAMLPQLFQMFAQADKDHKRSQGGLGIGLALAKSLVEMHGCEIEVHSGGEGCGSEFVVRLPLSEQQLPVVEAPVSEPIESNGSTHSRVLVVDDNRDAAASLAVLLKMLGNEVTTADNGPAALEAIESFRPSVVLLDLGMPGMSGFEVAERAARLQAERFSRSHRLGAGG